MTVQGPVADPWCKAPRHGTKTAYVEDKCRCTSARRLVALYENLRQLEIAAGRERLVDATGTIRRLQGLQRLGWTRSQLAQRLGVTESAVRQVLRRRRVRRLTAERVARLYDELSMRLPPDTPATRLARQYAERHGFVPPLAWDDDVIDDPRARPVKGWSGSGRLYDEAVIERVVREGVKVRRLTHAEAAEAVRRLRAAGRSEFEIEHVYGFKAERYPRRAS